MEAAGSFCRLHLSLGQVEDKKDGFADLLFAKLNRWADEHVAWTEVKEEILDKPLLSEMIESESIIASEISSPK